MSLFRAEDASDETYFDAGLSGVNQCIEIYDSYLALWPLWQNTMNYLQQWHSSGQNVMKCTLVYPFCDSPHPSSMGGLPPVSYKRLFILTSIFHMVFFVFIKFLITPVIYFNFNHNCFQYFGVNVCTFNSNWWCGIGINTEQMHKMFLCRERTKEKNTNSEQMRKGFHQECCRLTLWQQ